MSVVADSAGVDTWSACWYLNPDSRRFVAFRDEFCTVPSARGARLLPDPVGGHRVGAFPNGLVFAEGHPVPDRLARAAELPAAALDLQDAVLSAGVPLDPRERPFVSLGADSEGFAGFRRVDTTLNLVASSRSEGVAVLSGIAALSRDGLGHAEVRYGLDHAVETVYFRGYAGRRLLGRWYDKGLESVSAPRGTLVRGEDQRRWGKEARRYLEDLTDRDLRAGFHRRFAALWQASKGVTVAGHVVIAEKLLDRVESGELTGRQAETLAGHLLLRVVGGRRGATGSRSTMYNRERQLRSVGLVLADGVLDEVEVDVGSVLEAAMDSDVWGSSS